MKAQQLNTIQQVIKNTKIKQIINRFSLLVLLSLAVINPAQAEWPVQFGGLNVNETVDVTVDNEGNSYVFGEFWRPLHFSKENQDITITAEPSYNPYNLFIAKFDPKGDFVWVQKIYSSAELKAHNIAVDASNSVYVSLTSSRAVTNFGTTQAPLKVNYNDPAYPSIIKGGILGKIDINGSWEWVQPLTKNYIDYHSFPLTSGSSAPIDLTISPDSLHLFLAEDIFVNGVDRSLTSKINLDTGEFIWSQSYGASIQTHHFAVASKSDYFITGHTGAAINAINVLGCTIQPGTFVMKIYDNELDIAAGATPTRTCKWAVPNPIAENIVTQLDALIATDGTDVFLGSVNSGSKNQIAKLQGSSGVLAWQQDIGNAISLSFLTIQASNDETGNTSLYISGEYTGSPSFTLDTGDTTQLPTATSPSLLVAKLDASSQQWLWVNTALSEGNSLGSSQGTESKTKLSPGGGVLYAAGVMDTHFLRFNDLSGVTAYPSYPGNADGALSFDNTGLQKIQLPESVSTEINKLSTFNAN